MTSQLIPIVERFAGTRVLLVGDFMLDQYVFGDAERISPEAPVPVLRIIDRQDRVGGAGSVALNLATLGATASCCGMIGHDASGELVLKLLNEAGVQTEGLIPVEDRPTITKTRMVGLAEHRHRQQILRVDDEIVRPPDANDSNRLLTFAKAAVAEVDVICLEDYAKGVLMPRFCQQVIAAARRAGKPVLVDPGRLSDWSRYEGATAMTPNRAELEMGVGRALTDAEVPAVAQELVGQLKLDALVVTLGRDGALLVRADGSEQRFPTRPRAVYDNTGAGDAVLAMTAVALAAGAKLEEAVPLANVAGGLEVSKFGCVPITREEVLDDLRQTGRAGRSKVRTQTELVPELEARRARGETVVFTNGCFDILHPGHIELLEQSKAQGSLLVVGINSDASVREQGKGDDRPIRNQDDRARMLAALEAVDYVTFFDEQTPADVIETVAPDILIKGSDWANKGVVGREFVESRGGRVVLVDLVSGYSTTAELEKIRGFATDQAGATNA